MKGERELCRNLEKECSSRGNSKYKGLRPKSRCLTCLRDRAEARIAEIEWKGEYKDNKAKETLRSQITWGLKGQASSSQSDTLLPFGSSGGDAPATPRASAVAVFCFLDHFWSCYPPRKCNVGWLRIFFPYQCITTAQSGIEKPHNKCSWAEWMRDGGRIFSSLPCV